MMLSSLSSSSAPSEPPRRPRLLAQNRKLRHLRGLSLRNLSFAPRAPRLLRSADDADIPSGPPRKKKLGVLQESSSDIPTSGGGGVGGGGSGDSDAETSSPSLHPSRSSENLTRIEQTPARHPSAATAGLRAAATTRPGAVQRRPSLSNAHTSPVSRQKRLEDLADEAVGDVFFSLHDPARPQEPVYISEVGERSANFDFRFFDLSAYDTCVSRSCRVIIRIWTRRPKQSNWSFLVEELIDLRSLHFISTTLNREYRPNALIFHLEDGVYSLDFPDRISEPRQAPPMTTSSYNALMKLSNLESSIADAEETQRAVMQQMNALIAAEPADGADAAEEDVLLANKSAATS
ncbi:hypothetical protein PWT90_11199 [Aphanocladium album]|nr:hypothetical protein PWT90_11199 [Aphanocladium album]